MTDIETPEDRVREFLDILAGADDNGDELAYAYDGVNQAYLTSTDVRDLLAELDALRAREAENKQTANIVIAMAGTVTDTDRKNAAVRLAERVLGIEQ